MTPPPTRTHGPAGQAASGPSTPGTTRGGAANALAAPKGRRAALARAHGATLLFGASGIFGKLCQCSAPMLVCGRAIFAVAALTLAGLGKKQPPWRGLHACDLLALTISGTLLAAHFVMFFMGIQIGGVAVGTLGFACFPAFTTLIASLIYRERPSFAEMRGLGMVTLGLVCTTPSFSFAHEGTVGLLLGVASGLAYALVTVGIYPTFPSTGYGYIKSSPVEGKPWRAVEESCTFTVTLRKFFKMPGKCRLAFHKIRANVENQFCDAPPVKFPLAALFYIFF